MNRHRISFVIALATFAAPLVTRALPPPKTEAEMLQLADLVVDAECITILCVGAPVVDPQKTTTSYLSSLFPSKSYKGGLPNSFQIRGYTEAWVGMPPTGGWHQEPVPKGWVGKLYLAKQTDGTYAKVWWNAMTEDAGLSKPQALPACAASDGGVADGPPAKKDAAPAKTDAASAKADAAPSKPDGAQADGAAGERAPSSDTAARSDGAPKPDAATPVVGGDGCSCVFGERSLETSAPLALLALALIAFLRRRPRKRT